MGNAFEYMGDDGPVKDAFKMRNPWNIVTPPGYSTLYLDPFLFQNKFFATWQGIIDTDTFNSNMDNAQIIFLLPTCFLTFAISAFFCFFADQFFFDLHIENMKFLINKFPFSV